MDRSDDISSKISFLRAQLRRPVVFIGMMGSGKSRVGEKLAAFLGVDFFDTDRLVEERAGYPINEIFRIDGESKFREVERKVIMGLLEQKSCVIASGGGTVANEGVMDAVKEKAVSVWLKADLDETLKRIGKTKNRPLLKGADQEKTLRALMEKRAPVYARADLAVDTAHGSLDATVEAVIKALYVHVKEGNF